MVKLSAPFTTIVVLRDDLHRVVGGDRRVVDDDVDVRVVGEESLFRGFRLLAADVVVLVQDLALEVREVDDVEVDDADRADAGEGEVERRGAAEAAGADDEHLRLHQLALADRADLRHDDVPAVAVHLLGRERDLPAGDGGNDGHLVAVIDGRVLALE